MGRHPQSSFTLLSSYTPVLDEAVANSTRCLPILLSLSCSFLYGGVGFAVAAIAAISTLAFANRSIVWAKAMSFVWPLLIVLSAIRAILMIIQLNRTQDKMQVSLFPRATSWRRGSSSGRLVLTVCCFFCQYSSGSATTVARCGPRKPSMERSL